MSQICHLDFQTGIDLIHEKLYGELSFVKGQIQLWQGPNGVGKTSLLNYLRENDKNFFPNYRTVFATQKPLRVLGDFTSNDLISHLQKFLPQSEQLEIGTFFKMMDFTPLLSRPIRFLSGGENQILKLASCLMIKGDIYFLDEATSHLDEEKTQKLFTYLGKKKKNSSIVMIEHHPHAQKISDHKIFFKKNQGRLELIHGT